MHNNWREAEGQLVDQEDARFEQQTCRQAEHLLLAAGQRPGRLVHALAQDREAAFEQVAGMVFADVAHADDAQPDFVHAGYLRRSDRKRPDFNEASL